MSDRGGRGGRGSRGGAVFRGGGGPRGEGFSEGGDRGRGRGEYRGGAQRGDRGGAHNLPFRDSSRRGDRGGRGGRGPADSRGGRGRGRGRGDAKIYNPGPAPPYSTIIAQKENDIEKNVLKAKSGAKGSAPGATVLPLRPGYNTQGNEILLYANYMELTVKGSVKFHRYSIEIGPGPDKKVPSIKRCKRLVQLLLEEHFAAERGHIATDSRANLVSSKKLNKISDDEESTDFRVRWRSADESQYEENPDVYTVTVKFTGMIAMSDLIDYLTSSNASAFFANKSEFLQALNIVVGEHPKSRSDIASIGANKHFPLNPGSNDHYSLGEGLEVIRGYFVSVRAATARLLVNVQVKNVAVYEHGSLPSLIGKNPTSNSNLEKFLKTLRVVVTHLKDKKKKPVRREKSICGLAREGDGAKLRNRAPRGVTKQGQPRQKIPFGAGPNEIEFWQDKAVEPMKAPGFITVAYWFKIKHKLDVDNGIPVMNVGSRDMPSYVPADVCEVVAGQPAKMKLSANQTAQMINFAVRSPGENADSVVNQGAPLLGFSPATNNVLKTFGLEPIPKLITVPGRTLQAPVVSYKKLDRKQELRLQPKDASWNLRDVVFFEARRESTRWSWVVINPSLTHKKLGGNEQACIKRIEEWASNIRTAGIAMNSKPTAPGVDVAYGRDENPQRKVDAAFESLVQYRLDFILVVLPVRETVLYNTIKYLCDVKYGLLHACVVADKFAKGGAQYDANVALKVNLKLNGTNHVVGGTQLGIVSKGKTMLVGIDVTHPSPGSAKDAPSIAAIVASVGKDLSQFPAQLHVQAGKQEKVDALDVLLKSRLKIWRDIHKEYPENIIVYRDGVSEGQYDMVVNEELPQLKKACRDMCGQKQPRISIVVVGKRHHTRFYVTREQDASRSKNPPNGTVVDRGVTEARAFDFFLQSHAALQGTARPAHYIVVHDEIFAGIPLNAPFTNSAEVLIDLSHRLCYTFGRATKAVSICPPAYYADLVCERARCYLQDVFDPNDTSSEASSNNLDTKQRMVTIHERIKNRMFYI